MSFDDDALADMHVSLFDTFGVGATVQRGAADPVPLRVVVDPGVQRIGEFGQVVGLVTQCSILRSEWEPMRGDVVRWTDRFGPHVATIESTVEDDGFVAVHVMAEGVIS